MPRRMCVVQERLTGTSEFRFVTLNVANQYCKKGNTFSWKSNLILVLPYNITVYSRYFRYSLDNVAAKQSNSTLNNP